MVIFINRMLFSRDTTKNLRIEDTFKLIRKPLKYLTL